MKVLGSLPSAKTRISMRIPENQLALILHSMKKNQYGTKERSRWIEEAIENLLDNPEFWELVAENFTESGDNVPIPVTLDARTVKRLDKAVQICIDNNVERADKSSLIRAAITKRCIEEGGGVVEGLDL